MILRPVPGTPGARLPLFPGPGRAYKPSRPRGPPTVPEPGEDMPRFSLRSKLLFLVALVALAAGGSALVWWQRVPLLAWYYVRCLSQASEADREVWVERVVALEGPGVEALLNGLRQTEPRACTNTAAALAELGR